MKRILNGFLDLLFPPKCVFCHHLLHRGEQEICRGCRLTLPVCQRNPEPGPYLSGCVSALIYEANVRESLLRYKFHGMEQYAGCYGKLLAAACTSLPEVDAVTWIPVSRRRRWERGYDQARLLAVELSRRMDKPMCATLVKVRDNPAQSSQTSPAARRANVLGVYRAKGTVTGKKFLLVDDIMTTGATASEAARVLLTAGAAAVYLAVVAVRQSGETN